MTQHHLLHPLKIQCKSITIRLSSALNKDRFCYIDATHPVTHLLKKVNQAYMLGRLDKWCSESISQKIKYNVSALAEISCKKIYQQENIHILTSPPPQLGESGYYFPVISSTACLLDFIQCLRPYHLEHTSSRLITAVKQGWAVLVLGWVTAWEYTVL